MQIGITRNNQLVKNYQISFKNIKHRKFMILGLSAFNLGELQKGNLVFAPFFKNSSNLRYIFQHSFFDLGFSIGTAFMVAISVMILIQIAPSVGNLLKGNDRANWLLGIISIISMIVIFLI